MKGMGMPDFVVEILIEQDGAFREGRRLPPREFADSTWCYPTFLKG
jgi:hypothetical protein